MAGSMNETLSDLVLDFRLDVDVSDSYSVQKEHNSDPQRGGPDDVWESKWERRQQLGRGSYGTVWLEECTQGNEKGQVRAVKKVRKAFHNEPAASYHQELQALAKFSHRRYQQCFVRSFGWFETDWSIFIAMEYFPLGDLDKYIREPISETEACDITKQILDGLIFMHHNKYAHRDLKPANILVLRQTPTWWIKISDFGISKRVESTALRTIAGTESYLAPEVRGIYTIADMQARNAGVGETTFTFAVDIWSVGVIAFRMCSGRIILQDPQQLFNYVVLTSPLPMTESESTTVSSHCADFVQYCMAASPGNRPTSEQARSHPWIQRKVTGYRTHPSSSTLGTASVIISDTAGDASARWSTLSGSPELDSGHIFSKQHEALGISSKNDVPRGWQPSEIIFRDSEPLKVPTNTTDSFELERLRASGSNIESDTYASLHTASTPDDVIPISSTSNVDSSPSRILLPGRSGSEHWLTMELIPNITYLSYIRYVAVSNSGGHLLVAKFKDGSRLSARVSVLRHGYSVDPKDRMARLVTKFDPLHESNINWLTFSSDDKWVFVYGRREDTLATIHTFHAGDFSASTAPKYSFALIRSPYRPVISFDSKWIAIIHHPLPSIPHSIPPKAIHLYSIAESGQLSLDQKIEPETPSHSLAFSPTRPWLASYSKDGTIRVWEYSSGFNRLLSQKMTWEYEQSARQQILFWPGENSLSIFSSASINSLWNIRVQTWELSSTGQIGDPQPSGLFVSLNNFSGWKEMTTQELRETCRTDITQQGNRLHFFAWQRRRMCIVNIE